jgi:hypothetical protein
MQSKSTYQYGNLKKIKLAIFYLMLRGTALGNKNLW